VLQLTYISTVRGPVAEPDVAEILRTSRRNNAAADVTGLLLYNGRRFLQALEGPEPAVRAIYARVAADPRHHAVVVLSERLVAQRAFGAWAMAAARSGDTGQDDGLAAQVDALTVELGDRTAQALFRSFARVAVPRAA